MKKTLRSLLGIILTFSMGIGTASAAVKTLVGTESAAPIATQSSFKAN